MVLNLKTSYAPNLTFSNLENPYVLNLNYFNTSQSYDQTLLSKIHFGCNLFAFIFGCIICIILIFLTISKTQKIFKEYSRLLLLSVFIDLVYLFLNFVNQFVSFLRVLGKNVENLNKFKQV